jgi:hypothetical protein
MLSAHGSTEWIGSVVTAAAGAGSSMAFSGKMCVAAKISFKAHQILECMCEVDRDQPVRDRAAGRFTNDESATSEASQMVGEHCLGDSELLDQRCRGCRTVQQRKQDPLTYRVGQRGADACKW